MLALSFHSRRAALTGLFAGAFALALPSLAAAQDTNAAKLASLMEQNAFKGANRVNDKIWTIDYSGNLLAKFKVIATVSDKSGGTIAVFTNPVTRAQLPQTTAALSTMLRANHPVEYVKFGIDSDGDWFVRADMPATADAAFFKTMVELVAAQTDAVYGQLKPLLK